MDRLVDNFAPLDIVIFKKMNYVLFSTKITRNIWNQGQVGREWKRSQLAQVKLPDDVKHLLRLWYERHLHFQETLTCKVIELEWRTLADACSKRSPTRQQLTLCKISRLPGIPTHDQLALKIEAYVKREKINLNKLKLQEIHNPASNIPCQNVRKSERLS